MKLHLHKVFVTLLILCGAGNSLSAQTTDTEKSAPVETPAFKKLLAPNATVEKVVSGMTFTEGPVWHRDGYLLFTDVARSKIMQWDAKNGLRVWLEPSRRSNGLALDAQGRLLACQSELRRIAAITPDGTATSLADKFNDKRLNTTNDLTLARDGAVYFTDPGGGNATAEMDFSGVYRLSPKGELTLLTKDIPYPNGITFAPDGKTLYVSSTIKHQVFAFDVQPDGTVTKQRAFAAIYPHGTNRVGVADGIKTDAQGNLYVTGHGGIWVFDKTGQAQGIIPIPEAPSNCAFGDADFKTLYVTARTSLYRIRLTVAGRK